MNWSFFSFNLEENVHPKKPLLLLSIAETLAYANVIEKIQKSNKLLQQIVQQLKTKEKSINIENIINNYTSSKNKSQHQNLYKYLRNLFKVNDKEINPTTIAFLQ